MIFLKKILIYLYNSLYWFWLKPTRYNIMMGASKENKKLLRLFSKYLSKDAKILDVGCGYGRFLKLLIEHGYQPLGIDTNMEIVNTNKNNNLPCIHSGELRPDQLYDVIIMSHIIEHFDPASLLKFMNDYLLLLKPNGYLFILTPHLTKQFYMDFDHVRPYTPYSIMMVFNEKQQIQYYGTHQLELKFLSHIRIPYNHRTISYATQTYSVVYKGMIDLIGVLIYFVSLGTISINTGWIGVFKKISK